MNKYKIYVMTHPITGAVMYVGRTARDLENRFARHLTYPFYTKKKTPVQLWVYSLVTRGLAPLIKMIEETDDISRERYWINYYRSQGCDLKNYTHTAEHSRKISEGRKGMKFTNEHCNNMSKARTGVSVGKGKIIPQEMRDRISKTLKGRKLSDEHRAAISKGLRRFNKTINKEKNEQNII